METLNLCAYVKHISCAWKVVSVFVKRHSHHAICRVKCFFNAIAMMYVYVHVENTIVYLPTIKTNQINP